MPWVQYVGKRNLAGDVLGPNLITNWHFTDNTTGWTGSNATLSKTADGKLRVTVTAAGGYATQSLTTESGALYKFDLDATNSTGKNGFALVVDGSAGTIASITVPTATNGALSAVYFVAASAATSVRLSHSSGAVASEVMDFDSVKLRKVEVRGHATDIEHVTNGGFSLDQQWTKGTGWTIGSGVASSDGTQTATSLLSQQTTTGISARLSKVYDTSFTVSGYSAGIVWIAAGTAAGGKGTNRSANGTYTEQITADFTALTSDGYYIAADADFVGSVDNVSVKLAADNTWTLDFDISSLQYGRDQNVERVQMMDRSTDSQYFGAKKLISVTTDILAYGEWQFMEEFLDNAVDGQTVTFDPYGTESRPKAPGSYILVGSGITHIVGADTTERRQYQLQFRQV